MSSVTDSYLIKSLPCLYAQHLQREQNSPLGICPKHLAYVGDEANRRYSSICCALVQEELGATTGTALLVHMCT